jgi:hypothetical protein
MTNNDEVKSVTLWVHDSQFSAADLVVNSNLFPNLKPNDVLELTWSPPDVAAKPSQETANSNADVSTSSTTTTTSASTDGGDAVAALADAVSEETTNTTNANNTNNNNNNSTPSSTTTTSNAPNNSTSSAAASSMASQESDIVPELSRAYGGRGERCVHVRAADVRAIKGALRLSLAKAVVATLRLSAHQTIRVRRIEPERVGRIAVEHVEVMFASQYVGRGDMWRFRLALRNACVFVGGRVTQCGIRADVSELRRHGEPVLSGVVVESTNFVFRSRLAMITVCVQMSREMWQFDSDGALFSEKAVAFLRDLFLRWQDANVTHCVTLVLFSRTYYPRLTGSEHAVGDAALQRDERTGVYYRDFYRSVAYEEHAAATDDLLLRVKRAFIQYGAFVDCANQPGANASELASGTLRANAGTGAAAHGVNSSAAEGNLLEVLNLTLVQYERHYCDRDLNRTGQLVLLVTPGNGVFEVDAALARTAKDKIIEQGIGVDLICLGSHPVHMAPLFCAHDRNTGTELGNPLDGRHWHMPHWIQPSFYHVPRRHLAACTFSLDCVMKHPVRADVRIVDSIVSRQHGVSGGSRSAIARIYDPPLDDAARAALAKRRELRASAPDQFFASHDYAVFSLAGTFDDTAAVPPPLTPDDSQQFEELSGVVVGSLNSTSSGGGINRGGSATGYGLGSLSGGAHNSVDVLGHSVGSDGDGADLLMNHGALASSAGAAHSPAAHSASALAAAVAAASASSAALRPLNPFVFEGDRSATPNTRRWSHVFTNLASSQYAYSTTWKSLVHPASLPLTTDFFPSAAVLASEYEESVYQLAFAADFGDTANYGKRIEQLLLELVMQRLQQGYQLIVPKEESGGDTGKLKTFYLGMASVFHKITLERGGQNVEVKRYHRKRRAKKTAAITYAYNLWPATGSRYTVRRAQLQHIGPEVFPWNFSDQFTCGYYDELSEGQKYWRIGFIITPSVSRLAQQAQVMLEASSDVGAASRRGGRLASSTRASAAASLADDAQQINFADRVAAFGKFIKGVAAGGFQVDMPEVVASGTASASATAATTAAAAATPSAAVATTSAEAGAAAASLLLGDVTNVDAIVAAMRDATTGVPRTERKVRLRQFADAFSGTDAVTWLMSNVNVASRSDAERIAAALFSAKVIEPIGPARFVDAADSFYRLSDQVRHRRRVQLDPGTAAEPMSLLAQASSVLFGRNKSTPPQQQQQQQSAVAPPQQPATPAATDKPQPISDEPTPSTAEPQLVGDSMLRAPRRKVVRVPLQDAELGRRFLHVSHDAAYDPNSCFHIELRWVACAGHMVKDFVQTMYRRARQAGLTLVQLPLKLLDDPFAAPTYVRIAGADALPPGAVAVLQQELLVSNDFYPFYGSLPFAAPQRSGVSSASAQRYVHASGLAFATVTGFGFQWWVNDVAVLQPMLNEALALRQQFSELCGDEQYLMSLITLLQLERRDAPSMMRGKSPPEVNKPTT